MMTKLRIFSIFIVSLIILITNTGILSAQQDTTSSGQITIPPDRLEKIKLLKERVATKVAELRREEKTEELVGGEVIKVNDSTFTLGMGTEKFTVSLNQKADMYLSDGDRQKIKLADIESGQLALVIGRKDNDFFKANKVIIRPNYQFLIGKVSSIDRPKGQFILATAGGSTTIDVERSTKTNRYDDQKEKIVRSGFSKLNIGNTVHVVAETTDNTVLVTAIRVLIIPQQRPSPTLSEKISGKPTAAASIKPVETEK